MKMGKEGRSAQSHKANKTEEAGPSPGQASSQTKPGFAWCPKLLSRHSSQGENTPFGAKKERSQNRVFSDKGNTTVI